MAILPTINADTILSGINKARTYFAELSIPNLIDALEEDHDDLRKHIDILKDEECDLQDKRAAYERFTVLLKSHTTSEEKAVYDVCEKIPAFRRQSFEGLVEHNVADEMMKKISRLRNRDQWAAHVQVLAEMVEHHIDEEENEFFPELESKLSEREMESMKNEFISLRFRTQKQVKKDNGGVLAH